MSTPAPLALRLATAAAWRGYPFQKASIWPEVLTLLGSFGVSVSALTGAFLVGVLVANMTAPTEQTWAHKAEVRGQEYDFVYYAHTDEGLPAMDALIRSRHPNRTPANADTGEP